MNLLNLFRKQPRPVTVKIAFRDACRLTMAEFRQDPALVKTAARILGDPAFMMMRDVLRTHHLANDVLPSATLEERAIAQARSEGYGMCLNNLDSLGVLSVPKEEIEATFEQPELSQ